MNTTQLASLELDILLNLMSEEAKNDYIEEINDRIQELNNLLENSFEGTSYWNDDIKSYQYEASEYEESLQEEIEKNEELLKLIMKKLYVR